jgi:hypothetical protein
MANVTPYNFEPSYYTDEKVSINCSNLSIYLENARRFEGRAGNVLWCQCGFCSVMISDVESHCCKESSMISSLTQTEECVSKHDTFSSIALNMHTY